MGKIEEREGNEIQKIIFSRASSAFGKLTVALYAPKCKTLTYNIYLIICCFDRNYTVYNA